MADLGSVVAELAKAYFPGWDSESFQKLLQRLPVMGGTFAQLTQDNNQPKLEIGYVSAGAIVDYTYQTAEQTLSVLRISALVAVYFQKKLSSTYVSITASSGAFVEYTASVEAYQRALEEYAANVQKLLT